MATPTPTPRMSHAATVALHLTTLRRVWYNNATQQDPDNVFGIPDPFDVRLESDNEAAPPPERGLRPVELWNCFLRHPAVLMGKARDCPEEAVAYAKEAYACGTAAQYFRLCDKTHPTGLDPTSRFFFHLKQPRPFVYFVLFTFVQVSVDILRWLYVHQLARPLTE